MERASPFEQKIFAAAAAVIAIIIMSNLLPFTLMEKGIDLFT